MAPSATAEALPSHASPTFPGIATVKASVLHGPRHIRLEMRSIEEPGVGELQIEIKATGICGSDVSYYKKFANGDLCASSPLSLGHESSGIVIAIGASVTNFSIGDRVALEVGVPCSECTICRKGRYNLCKKMRFRSSAKSVPHFQGTLQERINHPAIWCHKIPSSISHSAAALLEPLSVAIHALNRASPSPGSSALVIGAGTVGLLVAAMARQSGCTLVTILDIDAGRIAYALEHGFATHGYVVPSPSSTGTSIATSGSSTPSEGAMTPLLSCGGMNERFASAREIAAAAVSIAQPLHNEEEAEGVDVTFECTGVESCMQTAIFATAPGGKVVMVGMGTPTQTVPLSAAHLREVDILGVFRYAGTYGTGIRLLQAGNLPCLDEMVTHRFKGLESVGEALELAGRTVDGEGRLVLKVVVEA